MSSRSEIEGNLRIISKAWGRQQGFAFFPWIDRDEQTKKGRRQAGFHEGPSFSWPQERDAIVDHMLAHQNHDLYWCPSLFEYPRRSENFAMDEHALWADLDEVDPHQLRGGEWEPTVAWETSPGRYQALWLVAGGDVQGASWPGNENQRLTYALGADKGGWDTVQLLRIPGWENHKQGYKRPDGTYPKGKLLWKHGRQWFPDDFSDLPELQIETVGGQGITDALEAEIDAVDRLKVLARVRLKLTKYTRDMLNATEAAGDRSDQLWQMERNLADVGCTIAEIVAVVRETVWNKYIDRADGLRRLITEASKAVAQVPERQKAKGKDDPGEELDVARLPLSRLGDLLRNVKPPKFLVKDLFTEGACGFIAGEPKSFKSWIALDLALSIATGGEFLGHFPVVKPGPVLYVQEEDPLTTLKQRTGKIWKGKVQDRLVLVPTEGMPQIQWLPPQEDVKFNPDIMAYVQQGVVISEEYWLLWLDEALEAGMDGIPYSAMFIDTLMMTAGDVDENKAQEMTTRIFKPMKTLSRKHNVALFLIHHMGKSEKLRPGQRLLGSVANHAWAEDSIYLSNTVNGDVKMDLESKSVPMAAWRLTNIRNRSWDPAVEPWSKDRPDEQAEDDRPKARTATKKTYDSPHRAVQWLQAQGKAMTTTEMAAALEMTNQQIWRTMTRAEENGQVRRIKSKSTSSAHSWKAMT
jgi:hypothetical protein